VDVIDWYGPFEVLDTGDAAALLGGLPAQWWINGGWALEKYTAVRRPHNDVDVGVFLDDLAAVHAYFAPTHQVWAVGSGALRPLTDPADLPDWAHQLWIRERADTPWLLDVQLTGRRDGEWVLPRDPSVTFPLDSVTWLSDDIRYLNPEIVLLFKAAHVGAKDEADLDATLPWLRAEARQRLVELLTKIHPGHAWLSRLR
jgi:hypothetical protein